MTLTKITIYTIRTEIEMKNKNIYPTGQMLHT